MNLIEIPRVRSLNKESFLKDYFKHQRPVVIEEGFRNWPAYSKWSLDYIRTIGGEKIVPLYDDRPVSHKDGFNQPHAQMRLSDYIDLLKREPTPYRIFLWNILKEVPELQGDFDYPDYGIRLLKRLPMLFFGGQDAFTFMHYDIDLANIFHFHFEGQKQCILFPQSQTRNLYKVPFSLITYEEIDFTNPDFNKWPTLLNAVGYQTELKHGEILYMPEGYWHYMRYLTPGFSMSLRGLPKKPLHFAKAIYNIMIMRNVDNLMRKLAGKNWISWKNKQALIRTNRNLRSINPNVHS